MSNINYNHQTAFPPNSPRPYNLPNVHTPGKPLKRCSLKSANKQHPSYPQNPTTYTINYMNHKGKPCRYQNSKPNSNLQNPNNTHTTNPKTTALHPFNKRLNNPSSLRKPSCVDSPQVKSPNNQPNHPVQPTHLRNVHTCTHEAPTMPTLPAAATTLNVTKRNAYTSTPKTPPKIVNKICQTTKTHNALYGVSTPNKLFVKSNTRNHHRNTKASRKTAFTTKLKTAATQPLSLTPYSTCTQVNKRTNLKNQNYTIDQQTQQPQSLPQLSHKASTRKPKSSSSKRNSPHNKPQKLSLQTYPMSTYTQNPNKFTYIISTLQQPTASRQMHCNNAGAINPKTTSHPGYYHNTSKSGSTHNLPMQVRLNRITNKPKLTIPKSALKCKPPQKPTTPEHSIMYCKTYYVNHHLQQCTQHQTVPIYKPSIKHQTKLQNHQPPKLPIPKSSLKCKPHQKYLTPEHFAMPCKPTKPILTYSIMRIRKSKPACTQFPKSQPANLVKKGSKPSIPKPNYIISTLQLSLTSRQMQYNHCSPELTVPKATATQINNNIKSAQKANTPQRVFSAHKEHTSACKAIKPHRFENLTTKAKHPPRSTDTQVSTLQTSLNGTPHNPKPLCIVKILKQPHRRDYLQILQVHVQNQELLHTSNPEVRRIKHCRISFQGSMKTARKLPIMNCRVATSQRIKILQQHNFHQPTHIKITNLQESSNKCSNPSKITKLVTSHTANSTVTYSHNTVTQLCCEHTQITIAAQPPMPTQQASKWRHNRHYSAKIHTNTISTKGYQCPIQNAKNSQTPQDEMQSFHLQHVKHQSHDTNYYQEGIPQQIKSNNARPTLRKTARNNTNRRTSHKGLNSLYPHNTQYLIVLPTYKYISPIENPAIREIENHQTKSTRQTHKLHHQATNLPVTSESIACKSKLQIPKENTTQPVYNRIYQLTNQTHPYTCTQNHPNIHKSIVVTTRNKPTLQPSYLNMRKKAKLTTSNKKLNNPNMGPIGKLIIHKQYQTATHIHKHPPDHTTTNNVITDVTYLHVKDNNITKNTEYTKTTINRKITNNILNSISAPQSSSTLRNTILRQQLQITCTLKNMLILNKFVSHKNGATAQQRCTKPRPHKTSNTNYNHATTIITKPTQITYVNTKSITLKVLKYRPYTNTSNNKSKICTQSHHKAQTLNRATNIYSKAISKMQTPRSNHTKITIQHTQKTMFRKQINKYIPGNLHTQLAQLQSKPSAKVLSVKQLHPKATPTRATSNHKPILQTRQSIARPQRNSTTTPTQTNSYISDAIQSLQTNTPPNRKKTQSYPSFTIEAPKNRSAPRNHHRSVKPAKHNSLCEGANMQPTIQNINQSSTANLPRTTKINKLHFYHSNQERKPESTNKEIMNITIKVQIKGNLNANINSTTSK
eukprot:gene2899-1881_t